MQTTTFTQSFATQYGKVLAGFSDKDVQEELQDLQDRKAHNGGLRDRDVVALELVQAEAARR